MDIKEKITELELEIKRLKLLSSDGISDEDMKIIKFFVENNIQIRYVCFDKNDEYYVIKFKNKEKDTIVATVIEHPINSYIDDLLDYDVDLLLEKFEKEN